MPHGPTRNISCPRCGGAAVYAGMVGMPVSSIYQCNACGRATWVAAERVPAPNAADPVPPPREPGKDEAAG